MESTAVSVEREFGAFMMMVDHDFQQYGYLPRDTRHRNPDQNGQALLIRYGYVQQGHSGVFHFLPLGLRVQKKIESLIDRHMKRLTRFNHTNQCHYVFTKSVRIVAKGEEENLRLIDPLARKYRDELRPRQGLLRTREFIMKDLYTFDHTPALAMETYQRVRDVYSELFNELRMPYLVAEASSGTMGGNLSHEYHLASDAGEDRVVRCGSCGYTANTEILEALIDPRLAESVAKVLADSEKNQCHSSIVNLYDYRLRIDGKSQATEVDFHNLFPGPPPPARSISIATSDISSDPSTEKPLHLTGVQSGDPCPKCGERQLEVQRVIEIGHTFFLGTRYSEPLGARVASFQHATTGDKAAVKPAIVPLDMGCHGIGVSRLIGAVANLLADEKGLNWPRVMAPFEVVVMPRGEGQLTDAERVYDALTNFRPAGDSDQPLLSSYERMDVVLEDRMSLDFVVRMHEYDRLGFPVLVLLGRTWMVDRKCEVQCRRLGDLRMIVPEADVPAYVFGLLRQL
ncbi:MAG: hypothetical protein M1826_005380 [Phylliscum demangeonii]|nr:MAG: hypothetical protein M1826_005380 [Phylliscum demangeonii]